MRVTTRGRAELDGLDSADISYLKSIGRDPEAIAWQVRILRGSRTPVPIVRPATMGDGVRQLESFDRTALEALRARAAAEGRLSSFIPASGSGTRLFQSLQQLAREQDVRLDDVRHRAAQGDAAAADALVVFDNLTSLALWPLLQERGCSTGSLRGVLDVLFGDRYHDLPKGLLPFHRYGSEIRTAFIEQIHEAADVTRAAGSPCRLHFTVAESHLEQFEKEWHRLRSSVERAVGASVDVSFSVQAPETDAVAIDSNGGLHREPSGQIAFRAGGHGALLVNLGRASGDVVLIKNIDNIARRDVSTRIAGIRSLVCGALLFVERETHETIRALRAGGKVSTAVQYLERQFGVLSSVVARSETEARAVAMSLLQRPIRVCAVVPTTGHTGGRPFWVREAERGQSLQIVESAEIDLSNTAEQELFHQTRHFNPVDMACSLRDVDGKPFVLTQYVDPTRALIAQKTVGGAPLKAYEHPGLWNGGMALWNTVFVEVPELAFNPVKSLADLASPGHRTPS